MFGKPAPRIRPAGCRTLQANRKAFWHAICDWSIKKWRRRQRTTSPTKRPNSVIPSEYNRLSRAQSRPRSTSRSAKPRSRRRTSVGRFRFGKEQHIRTRNHAAGDRENEDTEQFAHDYTAPTKLKISHRQRPDTECFILNSQIS